MAQNNLGQNQVFPIYDENGHLFHNLSLKKSTLELTGMNLGDKITGDVLYNGTLTFTMREYIEYNGVRYTLVNPPTQTRNGLVKDTSSDAGMTKYTFVFYHPMALLSGFAFNDVAVSDDEKQYLSESHTFSWMGKIPDYCRKLNKNLEGTEWVCYVGSSVDEAMLNKLSDVLSFDNATIADALKTFYDTWEVPYIVDSITGAGQYIDPVTHEDYYTMGKRFVIILGYPSNEITTTTTTSYDCTTSWYGMYRHSDTITIRKGATANISSSTPGVLCYVTEGFNPITLPFTPEVDTAVYVVSPYRQNVNVEITKPYVFQFGQGLGLKNNSRTPKNNKIVTRIVGYGSEDNIPYGYPQIRWYGDQKWEYTKYVGEIEYDEDNKPINAPAPDAYPLYMGILGGQYVKLIKHPFTRNHLMPSVYRETLFNKISPYNKDGSLNANYRPDETLIDYYDADDTFPNPCDTTAPSVEIHQFEDVKPELGETSIVRAYAYEDTSNPTSHTWKTIDEYGVFVQGLKTEFATAVDGDKLYAALYNSIYKDREFVKNESPASGNSASASWNFTYSIDTSDDYFWTLSCNVNYEFYSTDSTTRMAVLTYATENIAVRVLRADAISEPPFDWDDTMDDDGNYKQSYFKMTLPTLRFDLYACASITQEMKINMRSGACIGCTFNVMVDWEDYKLNFYKPDGTFDPEIGEGHPRNSDKYPDTRNGQVTLIVQKDNETFGTLMPNVYQQPKGTAQVEQEEDADQFVILGISLPEEYISNPEAETLEERGAEEILTDDMLEYMLENNVHYYEYPLQFDQHFLTTHTDILSQVKQNTIVRFMFGGVTNALYVKQMSIKFGEETLPKYDITLADDIEIVLNQIGQTAEDVSRIRVQMNELQKYYGEDLAQAIAERLSRVADDIALGRITFQQGINVAMSAVFSGELASQGFVHGMDTTGRGWHIDSNGNAEVESLRVRSFLEVLELVVNRLSAQEGDTLFSDNDQIETVTFWRNRNYFVTLKEKWDGYITNQKKGNILRGVINTLAARDAGISDEESSEHDGTIDFYTSWMRVMRTGKDTDGVSTFNPNNRYSVGDVALYGGNLVVFTSPHTAGNLFNPEEVQVFTKNTIQVVLYNNSATPTHTNFAPCAKMVVARWGHVAQEGETDEEIARLQRSFYISTTDGRITKLRGVDTPTLIESNYGTTLGVLPDFVKDSLVGRILPQRDYLYAQGVVVGDFIKIGSNGEEIETFVDRGNWDANTTYLYRQHNSDTLQFETSDVWHDGSYWRCKSPSNTGHEPSLDAPQYWERLMRSGDDVPEYEETWYAWSNEATSNDILTPPSDVSGSDWQSAIPSNPSNRAYLWQKSIKYTWIDVDTYMADAARYVRLSGTNGTSIHTKGSVDYQNSSQGSGTALNLISNPSDGDAYVVGLDLSDNQGWLYQWTVESNSWIPLGQFKGDSGKTYYAHIAWASSVTYDAQGGIIDVVGFQTTKLPNDTTHTWMGTYIDENPGQDPQNKLLYTWSFTKGDTGTSVEAKYSPDKSVEHTTFQEGDKYMKTRTTGGQWSDWVRIVGESGSNGDYTDYQFARSADKVIPQGQSAPTIDGQWSDTPVATTETYPYLWSKVVQVTWNGNTPVYGATKYIRLNGEDGDDGYNTATLILYQRASSTPVNKPNTLTYNFATNALTGETWNGWSRTIPSADGNPCYTIQAQLSSQDNTISVLSSMWGNATKLVEDGKGISNIIEYYKASSNSSGEVAPSDDTGWSTDPNVAMQSWGATNKYLWNYEKTTYTKGNPTRTTPSVIAIWTKDGDSGRGILSITNKYKATTTNVAPTREHEGGTGWSSEPVTPNNGQYLWNYEIVEWTKGESPTYTEVQQIGYSGTNGKNSVRIDIDNESDMIACDSSGKVRYQRTITLRAKIYDGGTVVTSGVTAASATIEGVTSTPTVSGGVATYMWTMTKDKQMSSNAYDVSIALTYNGATYVSTFTLTRVDAIAVYGLLPSSSSLSFAYRNGTFTPSSLSLYCGYQKIDANGTLDFIGNNRANLCTQYATYIEGGVEKHGTAPYNMFYRYHYVEDNGDGAVTQWYWSKDLEYGTIIIPNNTAFTAIEFALSSSSTYNISSDSIIDRETIPITKSGEKGDTGTSVHISNQSVTYSKQSAGNLDPTTLPYGAYPSSLSKGDWLYSKTTVNYDDGTHTDTYGVTYIGTDGIEGKGISQITEYYAASTSKDTAPSDSSFTTSIPNDWNAQKPYLWNYEKTTYTKGNPTNTTKSIIAIWTQNGRGIDSITNYYLATNQSSGVTRETQGWTQAVQAIDSAKPYLWNYEDTTWLEKDGTNSHTYTTPHVIGHFGTDGQRGQMGKNYYYGGEWDTSRQDTFKATDYETPYFTVKKTIGAQVREEKWVYVGDNFGGAEGWTISQISQEKCGGGVPSTGDNWEIMVTDFKYLIAEAMFSDWARLGEWVFNKDYMFSNDGKDANGNDTSFDDGGRFYGIDDQRNTYTPNAVLDSQTGRGWLGGRNIEWDEYGNTSLLGFTRSPKKTITTENIQRYLRQDITTGAQVLDFDKCGSCIELQNGVSAYFSLPLLSNCLATFYNEEQKDLLRSYVGTKMVVYNKTGNYITITNKIYYTTTAKTSTTSESISIGNNSVQVLECLLSADPVNGDEMIWWKDVSSAKIV